MALTAVDSVARIMAACPSVPLPSPASALAPAISTTPPSPMTTPNNRPTVSGSCRVHSKLIRQTNSGLRALNRLLAEGDERVRNRTGNATLDEQAANEIPLRRHLALPEQHDDPQYDRRQGDARPNQGNWRDGRKRDLRQGVGHSP